MNLSSGIFALILLRFDLTGMLVVCNRPRSLLYWAKTMSHYRNSGCYHKIGSDMDKILSLTAWILLRLGKTLFGLARFGHQLYQWQGSLPQLARDTTLWVSPQLKLPSSCRKNNKIFLHSLLLSSYFHHRTRTLVLASAGKGCLYYEDVFFLMVSDYESKEVSLCLNIL